MVSNKLDDILGEYGDFGFHIVKPDNFILELYFKDKKLGFYYQDKITKEVLQTECRNYLKSLAR